MKKQSLCKQKHVYENVYFYEIARKYRRTYQTSSYILDNPPSLKEVDFVKQQEIKFSKVEKPFIKGILESPNQNNLEKREK